MKLIATNIKETSKKFGKRDFGLSTGLTVIDESIRGLRPGNLILIGARPSMGKSSLMMDMSLSISKHDPVLVCSLEMPFEELQERALANLARLNYHRILSGIIDSDDKKLLGKAAHDLESRKLYVVDGLWKIYPDWVQDKETKQTPTDSLSWIIRKSVSEYGVKAVFVDHLQFIGSEYLKTDNESLRLHKITEALHFLTMELNIPIVLLSQLRRMDQERKKESTVPSMDDIRNSGQVEENSNIIMLLHRPDYYLEKQEIDLFSNKTENNVEMIICKNRGGPTGNVLLTFKNYCMSFEDTTKKDEGDLL